MIAKIDDKKYFGLKIHQGDDGGDICKTEGSRLQALRVTIDELRGYHGIMCLCI